jgi:hypothetical protein
VENYETRGGDFKKLQSRYPQLKGVNLDVLKQNWDMINGVYSDEGGSSSDDIKGLVDIVVSMKSLSAEEYAKKDATSRYIDSVFYELIESPESYNFTKEEVMAVPGIDKVDMERQKRLYYEYLSKHPSN